MDEEFVKYIFSIIFWLLKSFYYSGTFLVIKIFLGIYAGLLFVNVVLLLFQRGLAENYRRGRFGMDIPVELVAKKSKTKKRWGEIRKLLQSGNGSLYKVAIIECDNLIDGYISKLGYSGNNMDERLENVLPGQIENIEELREAHKIRNRIIHEENFQLTKKEAEEVVDKYEHFLRDHNVFD